MTPKESYAYVQPRLNASDTRSLIERRRRFRWLRPKAPMSPGELVWLTLYLIPFEATSRKGPGTITVSVEGRSGAFAIFEMHEAIVHGSIAGQAVSPTMPIEEAIALGRQELLHAILRQASRGQKPVIGSAGNVESLCYPFWVHYYERRRGLLDITVIDAITGLFAGGKIKNSILEAFKESAGDEHG